MCKVPMWDVVSVLGCFFFVRVFGAVDFIQITSVSFICTWYKFILFAFHFTRIHIKGCNPIENPSVLEHRSDITRR